MVGRAHVGLDCLDQNPDDHLRLAFEPNDEDHELVLCPAL